MTDNHLLLYRLGELMLEQEQHILPVDVLFEDAQIGDLVKSIQIDSPYQQMLLEGVITESVKDGTLYVNFTVEGYFHFILGEIIHKRKQEFGQLYLINIIKKTILNEAKRGIEQSLIRDILNNDFRDLVYLIDHGGEILDYCSFPLTNLFLAKTNKQSTLKNEATHDKIELQTILNTLLSNPTDNDFAVILESVFYLERSQNNYILSILFKILSELDYYGNISFVKIILKSIPVLHLEDKLRSIKKLEEIIFQHNCHNEFPELLFELGTQFLNCSNFDKAIYYLNQSLIKFEGSDNYPIEKIEKIFSNLGAVYWYKNDIEKSYHYFTLSYDLCSRNYGVYHSSTAGALHNLALANVLEEKYDDALRLFQTSLDIELKIHGPNHPTTARSYSNIGSVYLRKRLLDEALIYFTKALSIDEKILPQIHKSIGLDFNDIADVYFETGNEYKALCFYKKAIEIFSNIYGHNSQDVKDINDKVEKIKIKESPTNINRFL